MVAIGHRELSLDEVSALGRASETAAARYGKFGQLVVLDGTTTSPTAEVREALADMVRSHGECISAVALVVEGTGFRARLHRGVVSVIQAASGVAHPSQVFDSVGPAAVWLGGHVPHQSAFNATVLRQAVERLRS